MVMFADECCCVCFVVCVCCGLCLLCCVCELRFGADVGLCFVFVARCVLRFVPDVCCFCVSVFCVFVRCVCCASLLLRCVVCVAACMSFVCVVWFYGLCFVFGV